MWLIAEYRPVSLFSLKVGTATSTGAKSLLIPTPFAIRTALLDAAIRTRGLEAGKVTFAWLKSLTLAVRPPRQVVVTNLFARVQKPNRGGRKAAMQRSIAFREYVYLDGTLGMAIRVDTTHAQALSEFLAQVNYFGKRGSFFQLAAPPQAVKGAPAGFVRLDGNELGRQPPASFPLGFIQVMDDWGDSLTFERVDVYNKASIRLGQDRVRKMVILPYRLARSSKSYSLYERLDI